MTMWNLFKKQKRETNGGKQGDSGATVPARIVHANDGNALEVAAFYHAVNLRAHTFARANIVMERFDPVRMVWTRDIKNLTFAHNYRHLQYLMTVRPNSRMTASQFYRRLSEIRDMYGAAAIYLVRDGQDVYQMIPCHGVSYNETEDTYNMSSREYNKSWVGVDAKDVIILRGMTTPSYLLGKPMWKFAKRDLTLQLTANDLITKTYAKGGTFRAIVKQESAADPLQDLTSLNDVEEKKNVESMQDKWDKGDDFVYDPSAAAITPVSQSFQDLQLDLQNTKAIENIARYMGVPLPLMYCSTNAVYKSVDDAWHTFLHLTIEPMWEQLCEELNAKYLGEEQWGVLRFVYDATNICLDSENIKAVTASSRRSAGITTANEERAYMGLAPVEGGDVLNTPQAPTPQEQPSDEGAEDNE